MCRQVPSFCLITGGDHCAVLTCDRPRLVVAQDRLCCAKECMYGASQHVHSQHGGGAVNFVLSRKSGGPGRAPGNAGDKRAKRKRGCRSVAAVAARIERGYLKRTRTAGGTTCVQNNHVDSRGTGTDGGSHLQQLSARLQQQETAVTILTSESESLARQVQSMTGTAGQRVRVGVV